MTSALYAVGLTISCRDLTTIMLEAITGLVLMKQGNSILLANRLSGDDIVR